MGAFIAENMMKRDVITASEDDTILDAIELMKRNQISSIIITNTKKVMGIVTKGDIINRTTLDGNHKLGSIKLNTIMTSPVITANPRDEITDILMKMNEKDITHIIITEEEKLKGIISMSDIINPHVLLDILKTLPSLIALAQFTKH